MSFKYWTGFTLLAASLGLAACGIEGDELFSNAAGSGGVVGGGGPGTGGAASVVSSSSTGSPTSSSTGASSSSSGSVSSSSSSVSASSSSSSSSTGGVGVCGDNQIDSPVEHCDGSNLAGVTCATFGFPGGTLGCTADCKWDISQCGMACAHDKCVVGDELDPSCDPCVQAVCMNDGFCCNGNWDNVCVTKTNQICGAGTCPTCGDGTKAPIEQCDGMDLGGASCTSLGYLGGTLSCKFNCTLDASKCTTCGNGIVEPGELCDGANLAGQSCASLGYMGGTLSCKPTCALDVSQCTGVPPCAHDKCVTGTKLDALCDPCVKTVCMNDGFCCNSSWDNICVNKVNQLCGAGTCPP